MGENSAIEWTDHTMNFWIGCQEVSMACDHCYAREQNARWKWVAGWGPDGERRRTSVGNWQQLIRWNRRAKERGIRERVFCNSLSDFFDNYRNLYTYRREAWHYIERCSDLDFLILTKRPQNIPKMLPDPETGVKPWGDGWPNVWLGTTVENQEEADRRIPHLLAVPAAVRFLSCEPLLGPVNIRQYLMKGTDPGRCANCGIGHGFMRCPNYGGIAKVREPRHAGDPGCQEFQRAEFAIALVISGGESGPRRREMDLAWMRSLRDQCTAAGVAFFGKQYDKVRELPEDLRIRQLPRSAA